MQMFRDLTEAPGAPGRESAVREVMRTYIAPYADQIEYDGLGSLIARKTGEEQGPRVVIAAHLDEVGFMVTQITEDGFLKFRPLGGWWAQVMLAQRVQVQTRSGMIDGVIGSVPPHLLSLEARRKMVEIDDMFIDVGAASRKEAEEFGIRPGDAVLPVCPFTVMKNPKLLMAKAWDNRLGCAVVIEALKRLQEGSHPNTVYAVGTVMEEVGRRGGRTVGQHLQPDIAFSIDVGIAADTPGIARVQMPTRLGAGPEICIYDAALIPHAGLRDFVIAVAEEEQIPYQLTAIPGGATDAASLHLVGSGVPSLALSVPARYIHSHAALIHYDDYEHLVKLVVALLRRLDRKQVETLLSYE
ncbi:M42 family metallopeptidase [Brevibacillus sp. SYP-B805]|uniref:M42 family metallopeptidase n=1 Tax=Brevibacillus sp. SYP-B805 TaxID=1578199 RepID=UPI0013EC4383|nr:M42 family metallopeptidase [Brevibacillus sp. SYP-B805]NGQ94454.1 M42 family metallopeptidase [Brevibacillus sp. SYP-B805]